MIFDWVPGVAKGFFGFSIVTAVAQALPVDPIGAVAQVRELGATGMLITGCLVLWRAWGSSREQHRADIREKDTLILEMTKAQTAALVTMTESNRELRADLAEGQERLLAEVRKGKP